MKKKKNYLKEVIIIISIILFLHLTCIVFNKKINILDNKMISFIIGIRNDNLTKIMNIITNISSAYSLIVITILLFVIIKNKKMPTYVLINLIIVFLTSQIFKFIIGRPRPSSIDLVNAVGYSYPSGHSMVSMAYFGFLFYLIYKKINNKGYKLILSIITTFIILLIGFSRIYLGVHYLSDVIGGFLLSIIYLYVFLKIINKKEVL